MATGTFTIGQLARAAGMSVDDVQSYLDGGLLSWPRRQRGRSDDVAYHPEHLERLKFIKHALACGFTLDDVVQMVHPGALVTCGDVFALTQRRLDCMRNSGAANTVAMARLEKLRETCPGIGSRRDCPIIEILSAEDS
jgi:MerR family mercuric resistance operon transcriptional regulator